MLSNLISIGDKIDLMKKSNDSIQVDIKQFVSQLFDYGDHEAIIAMPINNGKLVLLEIGERYQLCFYTKRGLYQCDGVIVERFLENGISQITVRFLTDFEKLQRRQYYRLNYIMDIEYRIETKMEREYIKRFEENQFLIPKEKEDCSNDLIVIQNLWVCGKSNDISGGGIRFHTNIQGDQGNNGDRIRIKLWLINQTNRRELIVVGLIKSIMKLLNKTGYYEYRVEFLELSYEQREAIIRFIFQEERKRISIE